VCVVAFEIAGLDDPLFVLSRHPVFGVNRPVSLCGGRKGGVEAATVVSFHLLVASGVKLVEYDFPGREVVVRVDERKEPGRYEVAWNEDPRKPLCFLSVIDSRKAEICIS
jgi:hypothetical protein